MKTQQLGIDIGSTNAKICFVENSRTSFSAILPHEGDVAKAVAELLERWQKEPRRDDIPAIVTGTEARHRFRIPDIIVPMAIEAALEALSLNPKAVVSMGGEDLVVYPVNEGGRIIGTFAGNKCASGTGEFFRQQLGRMNLDLDDLDAVSQGARPLKLSSRCSVFMKSDCTHRLNKGEATPGDIALSLCKVMSDKVSDFLTKARIDSGQIVLIGGVTHNKRMLELLQATRPKLELVVPEEAAFFEAFGAALLAAEHGKPLPTTSDLTVSGPHGARDHYVPLVEFEKEINTCDPIRETYDPDAEYILGVDGGSTTTKVALVNAKTLSIVAEHYGRTHGQPIEALKGCLSAVQTQLGEDAKPRIILAATTGSSRELLGVFLQTQGVYNEIIAHAVGTSHFDKDVDTIFEIGGQDAKYIRLEKGVPIDYAMNEACSAGTGSFLEESAAGDLSIRDVRHIAPIALRAKMPLKFGEHCSAFINSDIRKAIGQGATREDITAGIIFSVVSNYLNRVVGNRSPGTRIALQGGVAKNPAVPLAFAQITRQPITVPPDPELMGCFGVAVLAKRKNEQQLLGRGAFDLRALLTKEIETAGTFTCKACDSRCSIRNIVVDGHKYPFGGGCSKFTVAARKKIDGSTTKDYIAIRTQMMREQFAPDPRALEPQTDIVVGIPAAFSFHSLWPLYSWFFHTLGVRYVVSDAIEPDGIAKAESSYCFPAEIAHGAIENILKKNVDFIFLPHFQNMPSMEPDVEHGILCPLTQGLPFFARKAFDLEDARILRTRINFKHGWDGSREDFEKTAKRLGFTAAQGARAYEKGMGEYHRFLEAYRRLGEEVLEEIKSNPQRTYVALFGRPYNAFTRDANMGIPRKFTSQGITVVPFDMIFREETEIFPNMYWYYGQQDMKAVMKVLPIPNLYMTWVSNFSCAPDSFMLHYIRWMMGQKPYLVLEIDSHTADAGIDTRIEAFLDVVESYRRAGLGPGHAPKGRRYRLKRKREFMDIIDDVTGEHIDVRDPRVKVIFPSMGDLSTEAASAAAVKAGINASHLPVPDAQAARLARSVASGKECIPALLVLGSILRFFEGHPPNRPDEIFLFFVPSTSGPCRTGQYFVFYERLFEELGLENAVILVGEADNSYREMGPTFNKEIWWALTLGDYYTDVRLGIRLLAKNVEAGMKTFEGIWDDVVKAMRGEKNIDRVFQRAGQQLAAIPKKRNLEQLKKVLVVGEIFVRRDTFSVREVTEYLVAQGIFPKVTDITEWVRYTDFTRKTALDEKMRRSGVWGSIRSGVYVEQALFQAEKAYKDYVERRIAKHLLPTGLLVRAPHDMKTIMTNAENLFIDKALESEATISAGVGATAMDEDFDGVVIISPFACLPGRLLEGVYVPWARHHGYPVLVLENDGQPYPPSTRARMEIFAHNVLRFERPAR